jgi:hypothetical protein
MDTASLKKLWSAGFAIDSLEDAHTTYKISPIRSPKDVWCLLGYTYTPQTRQKDKYGMDILSALALPYPDPASPGHTYDYTYFMRIRPSKPIVVEVHNKQGRKETETHKYEQSHKGETHSEPYFLMVEDQWTRVMSPEFPLIITEGELKACALGLANFAAIGFPGCQMMYAPAKSGKNKLHHSLDPDGPRKGKTIPIRDRWIYVAPDSDFVENKSVRTGFQNLIRNLVIAGADPAKIRLLEMPRPESIAGKMGIDDYLASVLGERWSESDDKVSHARELVEELIEKSRNVNIYEFVYKATSHIRGADRFLKTFDIPDKYLGTVRASDISSHNLWAMYNCDHYKTYDIHIPSGGTSTRVAFSNNELSTIAREVWEEGVRLETEEGDAEGSKALEMGADFPNRVYGLVGPQLTPRYNETLIEPFEGITVSDRCLRIRGGLINVYKCFETGVDWDRRAEWLLPPNYRWFGTGQVAVSLTNLEEPPECPVFTRLVEFMFDGDTERIECLQKAFGKILLSPMFLDYNQFFAFFGTAGSGKSTLTNLLITLIGQHDVAVLRGNFGGRFDTSELPGKRLILFPENEDGSNHHFTPEMATTIKKITGRDMIVCEKKGAQPISARVDAEIMIVGNAPPTIEMDEEAFLRRAVFLRADNKILRPDPGISKTTMETVELPGILLWALKGAAKIHAGAKLMTPETCRADLDHATVSMNLEKRFVASMIVEKAGKRLLMTDLEEAYRQWLRHLRLPAKEPGWGKLTGAIRDKYNGQYVSEPTKDANRVSTRAFKGLAVTEQLY